jgi:hypothetical protein
MPALGGAAGHDREGRFVALPGVVSLVRG